MISRSPIRCGLFLAILSFAGFLEAESPPPDTQIASYEIDVLLDPETHRLVGSQRMRWINRTQVATDEIYLHLYLNAFASSETTFMRERDWRTPRRATSAKRAWGWIRVDRLSFDDGSDLLPAMEFVRPDDDNPEDYSLARIGLPRPVEPGGVIDLELDFEAQLPGVMDRTGFAGDFHFVAQWFPKIAVFRGERGWNSYQYHALSEYFADFGRYLVEITIPEEWVLGATGIEVRSSRPAKGQRTVVYRADRVHDFAWCTAPSDLMEVVEADFEPGRDVPMVWLDRASRLLGMGAAELELPPMELKLILPRQQRQMAQRMLRAARLSVAWFGLFYGAYPYPQLTIVSPPLGARGAGGMEYPTLFTTGADRLDAHPPFSMSSDIEALTFHEFGHQYFQGLLASNEFEEAWLDEGLTSYAEVSGMTAVAADDLVPEIEAYDYWGAERLLLSVPKLPVTVDRRAWEYRHGAAYSIASYTKAALALRTLEGLIGSETMARGMRSYFDRFRFRHPTGSDLVEVLSEASGQDLGPFFDQAIHGDVEADWAVLSVRQRRPSSKKGFGWDGEQWRSAEELESAERGADRDGWIVDLQLARRGEFVGPVEVELRWSHGVTERRTWGSETRWVRWELEGSSRLEEVVIDPDGVWALETRRADNYWRDRPAEADHPLWWLRGAIGFAKYLFLRWS